MATDADAAITQATAEIKAHADSKDLGTIKARIEQLYIGSYLIPVGYPREDQRQAYATRASNTGTEAANLMRNVSTIEGVNDAGYAMILAFEIAIISYMTQRPPRPIDHLVRVYKNHLEYLLDRLSRAPDTNNTISDTAVLTYADLLVFMEEMGITE